MSLDHNPKIVTDGLVFYYDMANTQKSWKGAPSTNYLNSSITWGGDGSDQTGLTKGYTEITDSALMFNNLQTFLWTPGTSLNCYLQTDDIIGGTNTVSTVWTFSCYIRRFDWQQISSMMVYMYYPSSDGSAAGTITDEGNGWYRISRTRTGTSSYISLCGFTGMVAGMKYYLSGAMLTMNDIVVPVLLGNTSRSNTQALLDLTKNNIITVNNLTYNSNNTFSFNGINQTLETNISGFGNNTTWIAWIKGTGNVSSYNMFMGIHLPYFGFYGADSLYFSNSVNSIQQTIQTATNLSANTWYHAAFTTSYDGTNTTMKIYTNGIETATGTYSGYQTGQNIGYNFTIGDGHRQSWYRFDGQVPMVQIYNRTLTSNEVKQNFYAFRGRFNI